MSAPDDPSGPLDLALDLEKMFLPDWAKRPPDENRYADHPGETDRRPGRRERGDRPPRPRPAADRPLTDRPAQTGRPRREPPAARPPRGRREPARPPAEEAPPEPPPVNVAFVPEDQAVELLVRQIRMTGRAYPLFDIARLILEKPERHAVTLSARRTPEGAPVQPLFVCALDESVWLSEDEAVRWVLSQHFTTFYQPERTKVDPPKGTYTFVAQCGLSGVILGPPNYHGYQEALRKLHAERFARMPFETYKARVRIVRDEAVVKKWIEEQSWRTEYLCLNLPEPLKLASREEVEQHFRATHLPNIIRQVETVRLSGPVSRRLRQPALARLLRQSWEQQRRFPLQVATVLSQMFAARGLQFFKVNRTVTHVAVARPRYLDLETTPVSDGVRRIVQFVHEHPGCSRRDLLQALAPRPAPPPPATQAPAPGAEAASAPAAEPAPEPTPEETQVIADLHWLVHQGHVLEFANGALETAKKPAPRPPKPEPAPAPAPTAPAAAPAAEAGAICETPAGTTPPVESAPAEPAPAPAVAAPPEPAAAPAAVEPPAASPTEPEPGGSPTLPGPTA